MNNYSRIYEKSRKSLMQINFILASAITCDELVMFLTLDVQGKISLRSNLYILTYIVLPTCINFVSVIGGYLLLKYFHCTEMVKNYIPVLVLAVLCLCISSIHNVFPSTISTFCVPILITVIYGSKSMTRAIFYTSLLFQITGISFAAKYGRQREQYFLVDALISIFILFAAYGVSLALITYENEKKKLFTESLIKQLELQEELLYDPLTRLFNQGAFGSILEQAVEQGRQGLDHILLAVIDLDNFKLVNDTYGHLKGNHVLLYLSNKLKERAGSDMSAARYGGEEFAVIFRGKSLEEAQECMNQILEEVSKATFEGMEGMTITFSCGIVSYQKEWSAEKFFDFADQTMYQAKKEGKNRIVVR